LLPELFLLVTPSGLEPATLRQVAGPISGAKVTISNALTRAPGDYRIRARQGRFLSPPYQKRIAVHLVARNSVRVFTCGRETSVKSDYAARAVLGLGGIGGGVRATG